MSSDLRLCCMISYVVIGRHILTCRFSTHGADAGPPIRVAAPERSMARVHCQGVIMSRTCGTTHTTWRSMSLAASKRPRLTLCGTPGRDVLLEPVVDGPRGRYDLRVIDIPTKLARGQCHDSGRNTPTNVNRGGTIAGGTVTSETTLSDQVIGGMRYR